LGVIRSLGRGKVEVHIGWQPAASLAVHSRYVRKAHALPPYAEQDDAWKAALIDLMKREHFDLVIPCSDPVQIPLQRHRRELERFGSIYLLDDQVFKIVSDKFAMNALARTAGVRVPRERLIRDAAEAPEVENGFQLPVVLKPRSTFDPDSVGQRQAVEKAYTWEAFTRILNDMLAHGPVAVQENFIGQGVGVELLLHHGQPLLEFQHVRLHEPLHGGGSYYRKGVAVSPALKAAALALLGPLRYTGVAMVEFKVNQVTGDWTFIEVNARFWGSLPLAVASGADFPLALFELLVNGRTTFPANYRKGLCCRYWRGDLAWQRENLFANRSDPTLATRPLRAVAFETIVSFLTLRERSDTFTLDDPKPGLAELGQMAHHYSQLLMRNLRRRWLDLSFVRRRLQRRAQRALTSAKKVLFVCKGNICRSPFAQYFGQGVLASDQTCISAGYYPVAGRPSPKAAVAAAARWNIDLSTHRSVRLTESHIRDADAVFVFDAENYDRLRADYGCDKKVFFLGSLSVDGPLWIDDPYGQEVEYFVQTYERICKAIAAGLHKMPR
jgi:protein-tyrosine-phosphatase/predicted ATP-grasp superfamily ATP-dependent carboligase